MKELIKAVTTAKKVIGPIFRKMPVLGCVRIEQSGDELVIQATDLELNYTAKIKIGCIPELPEPIAIDCSLLLKTLKSVKRLDTFRHEGNMLTINHARIFTLPAAEFPIIPTVNLVSSKPVNFNPEDLLWVKKAMADDCETSYALKGVYFDTQSGNMVATDGRRLHLSPIASDLKAKASIIPTKVINLLSSMKDAELYLPTICNACEGKGKVFYPVCEKCKGSGYEEGVIFCSVVSGNETLQFKAIEGVFPDYKKLIPNGDCERLTVDRNDLMAAIDQTDSIRMKSQGITLKLNGSCSLRADNKDAGMMEVPFIGTYTGTEEISIGINAKFLKDALSQEVNRLSFCTTKGTSNVIVDPWKPIKIEGNSHLAIVMPIKL